MDMDLLNLMYHQVVEIWKRFCELHTQLYELTCDEYSLLLASEILKVEDTIQKKEEVIEEIKALEEIRQKTIDEINKHLPEGARVSRISELLDLMSNVDSESNGQYLHRFNLLLIDIISKVYDQNKRNQLFLNKAMHSLKEVKLGLMGKKSFNTYNSQGHSISQQRP